MTGEKKNYDWKQFNGRLEKKVGSENICNAAFSSCSNKMWRVHDDVGVLETAMTVHLLLHHHHRNECMNEVSFEVENSGRKKIVAHVTSRLTFQLNFFSLSLPPLSHIAQYHPPSSHTPPESNQTWHVIFIILEKKKVFLRICFFTLQKAEKMRF